MGTCFCIQPSWLSKGLQDAKERSKGEGKNSSWLLRREIKGTLITWLLTTTCGLFNSQDPTLPRVLSQFSSRTQEGSAFCTGHSTGRLGHLFLGGCGTGPQRERAQPQTEICTLTFEMPFANSLGDRCQVTEDKIVNTGTSVCSCAVTCVQDTLSQG